MRSARGGKTVEGTMRHTPPWRSGTQFPLLAQTNQVFNLCHLNERISYTDRVERRNGGRAST